MTRHVDPESVELLAEPQNDLVGRALVGRMNGSEDASVTWIRLDGHHRRLRSGKTTRIYYVLSGSFVFDVEPDCRISAGRDHTVVLDPSTAYSLSGTGEYLVINAPAFTEGDDQYL